MEKTELKDAFSEFKNLKNIDRPTMMGVLEDVFKTQLAKTYGTADNFDVIINIDKGDCEIYWNREVVEEVEDPNTQIALEEVNKDGEEYEITSVEDVKGRGMYLEVLAKKVVATNG